MKRVRITIDPTAITLPPVYDYLSGGEGIERTQIVNWNVSEPPTGFLIRIDGAYDGLSDVIEESDVASDAEIIPLTDRSCYLFIEGELAPGTRALFENFTQGSLLTVPPVTINADGTSTFTLVGTESDIQAAIEGVPDPVPVAVEAVGGERVADEGVLESLTDRQQEAVRVALSIGYYEVPREATVEDVAAELDVATATAAEHLRKAESTVFSSLFG